MTFKEYAKKKNINEDDFPFYGLTVISKVFMIILAILYVVLKCMSMTFLGISRSQALANLLKKYGYSIDFSGLAKASLIMDKFLPIFIILAIVFFILFQLSYLLRSKSYERFARKNDKEARKLKKNLLKMSMINDKIRATNKQISSSKDTNYQARNQLTAYNHIKSMQVEIHTRESLDENAIKKYYKISIPLPREAALEGLVTNEIKNYNMYATKACGGLIQFGQPTVSVDRSKMVYAEEIIVPDTYEVTEQVEVVKEETYESTFDRHLFTDRSVERNTKIDAANSWGNNTAKSLDMILATMGVQVIRKGLVVGSANVLVVYQLSFNLSINEISTLGEKLDNVLRTQGVSAFLDSGDLKVSIPTPKSLSLPIDLPTMYEEVFG